MERLCFKYTSLKIKILDLSKNFCYIKIDNKFLDLIEKLKFEYLDINQNAMDLLRNIILKITKQKIKSLKFVNFEEFFFFPRTSGDI